MCGGKGLFQVEDLPVGPRWFCTEKHFAQYAGLPVKESGYYGFDPIEYEDSGDEPEYNWENDNYEAESFESELERKYFTRFGDERGGKEWGEYNFTWFNDVGDWKPIDEDTTGWDEDDYEEFRENKEYDLVNDMLSDSKSRLYRWIELNQYGDDEDFNTSYKVINEEGDEEDLSLLISWEEPEIESQKIQYYKKEPLHRLQFLAESFEGEGYTTHRFYGKCGTFKTWNTMKTNWTNENHRTNIICDGCGKYACEDCGREPPHIVKRSQPDMSYWCDNCYAKWSDYAFEAESKKLPPVEKAIDTGIASGATMEGLETLMAAESHKNHIGKLPMPKLPLSQKEIDRWAKEIRRGKSIMSEWPSPTMFFREAFKKPIVGKDKNGKEIVSWTNKLHPFYPVYYIVADQEKRWKLQKESQRKTLERNKLIKQIKEVLHPPHQHSYWSHGEDGVLGQAWLIQQKRIFHKSGTPIGVQKDEGRVGKIFPRPILPQQTDAFYEYLKKEMKSGTDAYGNQYGIEHYKPIMGVIIDAYNDYRLHFDYDYLHGVEIDPNSPHFVSNKPQDERPAFLYIDTYEKGLHAAKKQKEDAKRKTPTKPKLGDVSAKPKPKPTPKPKIPNPAYAKWLKDYENYEAHYHNLEKISKKLNGLYEEQTLINITTTSSTIKSGKIDLTRTMNEGLDGGNEGNIDSDIEDILDKFPNTVRHFNIQYDGYNISMKSANSMREEISSRRPPKYLMEKNAESFASWNEHTCEHCDSTDIDYGNNWKCHDCGRYAAEYNRDSKGRFSAKPVITLTTAAIVGFVGAYLWGRRN